MKHHTSEMDPFLRFLRVALVLLISLAIVALAVQVARGQEILTDSSEPMNLPANPDSDGALILDILRDLPTGGDVDLDRWRIELLAPVSRRVTLGIGYQHEEWGLAVDDAFRVSSYGVTIRARIYIGGR